MKDRQESRSFEDLTGDGEATEAIKELWQEYKGEKGNRLQRALEKLINSMNARVTRGETRPQRNREKPVGSDTIVLSTEEMRKRLKDSGNE